MSVKLTNAKALYRMGAKIAPAIGKSLINVSLQGDQNLNVFESIPDSCLALLDEWFLVPGKRNLAVFTGAVSGNLNLLDIDVRFMAGMEMAVAINNMLNDDAIFTRTVVSRTPRGGYHIWFRSEEPLKTCVITSSATYEEPDTVTIETLLTLFANSADDERPSYGIFPPGLGYEPLTSGVTQLLEPVPTAVVASVVDRFANDGEEESRFNPQHWPSYMTGFSPEWI